MSEETNSAGHEPWPRRALILLALGLALGLAVHLLTRGPEPWLWTENPLRLGTAAFLSSGGIVLAFSLERVRWLWAVVFALVAGLVIGFVTFWNGPPGGWSASEGWQLVAGLLAVAIAVPLFQSARDAGRRVFSYRAVHAHAWTNLVLGAVAWAFVLAALLLTLLLSELFSLIGITLLRDLLREGWFMAMLVGGALGAAIGLLRDRDRIIGLLQRVATAILSVLAPFLAAGLVLFVAALPFTGLGPLWDKTSATTPILLACVIGAIGLINAAIGNSAEEESRAAPIRWGAAALAGVILPLALVATVSTAMRVRQHGFTPDRLWALVFIAVTLAVAGAYLWSLIRGRSRWTARVRRANLRLAAGICILALFLALPIVSFGAISTRDQLARLESGKVSPERFDWAALRFDFGPSGRRALERLARSSNAAVAEPAKLALNAQTRWNAQENLDETLRPPAEIRVRPQQVPVPDALRAALLGRSVGPAACRGEGECLLFWRPGERTAVAMLDRCPGGELREEEPWRCELEPVVFELRNDLWVAIAGDTRSTAISANTPEEHAAEVRAQREGAARGEVEIREVTRRQLFIGGKPEGEAFE